MDTHGPSDPEMVWGEWATTSRADCLAFSMSPTARVGPSVPRQDRPVREGTRVASIETGLAAAAAKLSQQVRKLKGSYRSKSPLCDISLSSRHRSCCPYVETTRARVCQAGEWLQILRRCKGARCTACAPCPRKASLINMVAL